MVTCTYKKIFFPFFKGNSCDMQGHMVHSNNKKAAASFKLQYTLFITE